MMAKVAGTGKKGDASNFKDCVCSAFSECTCSASKRGMRALSENALVVGGRKQAKNKNSQPTGSDEAEKFSKEALKNVQWTQVRAILSISPALSTVYCISVFTYVARSRPCFKPDRVPISSFAPSSSRSLCPSLLGTGKRSYYTSAAWF